MVVLLLLLLEKIQTGRLLRLQGRQVSCWSRGTPTHVLTSHLSPATEKTTSTRRSRTRATRRSRWTSCKPSPMPLMRRPLAADTPGAQPVTPHWRLHTHCTYATIFYGGAHYLPESRCSLPPSPGSPLYSSPLRLSPWPGHDHRTGKISLLLPPLGDNLHSLYCFMSLSPNFFCLLLISPHSTHAVCASVASISRSRKDVFLNNKYCSILPLYSSIVLREPLSGWQSN